LTFQDARLKLLAYVRDQVRNGEFTERGFARLIGISQPHAHNVLKGVRNFSPEIFDLALKNLHLSLLDLVPTDEIEAQLQHRAHDRIVGVPFLELPIGPGEPWPDKSWHGKPWPGATAHSTYPAPFPFIAPPAEWMMVRIASDSAMATTLSTFDIALVDTSPQVAGAISPRGVYVVERNGEALIRYIRAGAKCHYLVSDRDMNHPTAWEALPLSVAQLTSAVKARVIWLGRERERDAMPQRGRLLYDPISS